MKLLYENTTERTFSLTSKLCKQEDGVAMAGTLSVTLSNCFINKMENDIAMPLKPKLHGRYIDKTYNRRSNYQLDELFQKMNKYHPNINLTV